MIRFARYLFLIFLLAAILPLICLFVYSNKKIAKMEYSASHHILNAISRELNYNIENYLKVETVNAMKKLYTPQTEGVTKNKIKEIFPDAEIEFLSNFPNEITYYYEIDNDIPPKLYSTVIIPFSKKDIHGIKIKKAVEIDKLKLPGPFYIELYSGNKIDDKNLIAYMRATKTPKEIQGFKESLKHQALGIPKNKRVAYKIFNFDKNYTKNDITVLIKTSWHIPPANPYERRAVLFIIITGVLLSLFVARYININFINPFLKLSAAAKRVKSGDLNISIKINTTQKTVQETSTNFNEMVKGLKEKEELRTSFIRNLTHDLRTPLIAQERALSMISSKFIELNLQDEIELAKSLEKNTSHLLRMVNLLLESYQFNIKKENLEYEKINLKTLIDDCFIKIKPLADEKMINLVNLVNTKYHIHADKTCVERIIINLIGNSIDNLKKEGYIEINAVKCDTNCKIIIKDNGNGISKEDIEHIFDRHYSSKSFNRKIGSGLGLDVCKKLTEILDGKIEIKSEIDKYTKFTITLPNKLKE